MPSKRKKNKRRMRRVQAQRRALEEQYASSGKGTPGVCAVSAPIPAQVPKTPECPVPVSIPLAVITPVDVPAEVPTEVLTEVPAEVPAEVLTEVPAEVPAEVLTEVPAEVPPSELAVLEVPGTDAVKDEVVKATEDLEQSLVESPAEEPAVIEEDESITVPVLEAISSIDEPVSIPAESEIQFEDTTPVATETHALPQVVETVDTEREVEAELPAKDPEVEVPVPVPEETVTTAETLAEVEAVTETVAAGVEPVAAAAAAVEVDGHVAGVVEEPAIEAEAITVETEPVEVHRVAEVTEDVHAEPEPEEFLVEAAVPTEALVEPEPEQQQQTVPLEELTPTVEFTIDPVAEEFVVNESVLAVATTVAEEQIPETTTDAPKVPSETLTETIPAPEPVPVAKEIIQDLAVTGGLTVDAINGCLGATEVAIEG